MKTLCTICARGGSKGVPGKNLAELGGKPLIAHTIELARGLPFLDRVLVSTDSEEIAEVARRYGAEAPFLRPAEFSNDSVSKLPALRHALQWVRTDGFNPDLLSHFFYFLKDFIENTLLNSLSFPIIGIKFSCYFPGFF